MKNRRIRRLIEILFIVVIIVGFVLFNCDVIQKRRTSFVLVEDNSAYVYQVESIDIDEDELVIRGWFFESSKIRNVEHETTKNRNISIIIYDLLELADKYDNENLTELKRGIKTNTIQEKREDINSYFSCEYDYAQCGFVSRVNKSYIDLINGKYMLVLKQDEDIEIGICLGYITNGGISYINPGDEMTLDVTNTDLDIIVSKGVCLASFPQSHVCVFQYKESVYWIADEYFCFNNDKGTYINYQIETTQFENLPSYRIENNEFWDDRGNYFECSEITGDINCGKYRVYMRELPKEYSITSILTGYFDDGKWIWKGILRPDYRQLKI